MLEINKVFLLGNLTRDPDVRYLPSGTMLSEFDLAVNRSYKDKSGEYKEETLFIRIESWGKQAEFVSEYLKKGRKVYVEGRLRSSSWEAKDGTKRSRISVSCDRIQFADPRPGSSSSRDDNSQKKAESSYQDDEDENSNLPTIDINEESDNTDNDLPF
jgi:single-strand DNA-binding protein